ncbi:hypothetical protein T492DRAFT_871214 [Pavlovales sp. CCMP2436]|nr:hypothetical protein T492DRAFT_871214 [Pavlovales sp. CCMP2436]
MAAQFARHALCSALSGDARGAALLADDVAARLIAENGGLALLVELAVSSVHRLGAREPRAVRQAIVPLPGAPPPTHVVVLSTLPVDQLGALLEHAIDSSFERCVVLCSLSSLAAHDAPGGRRAARRRRLEEAAGGEEGEEGEAGTGDDDEEAGSRDGDEGEGESEGGDEDEDEAARTSRRSDASGGDVAETEAAGADARTILALYCRRWSAQLGLRVEARLLRVCTAPIGPLAFVVPGHERIFPLLPADERQTELAEARGRGRAVSVEAAGAGGDDGQSGSDGEPTGDGVGASAGREGASPRGPVELDWEQLPATEAKALDSLAHALRELLASLGAQSEIYALGQTARVLARRMHTLPIRLAELVNESDEPQPHPRAHPEGGARARSGSVCGSVAIVLVDRTLDLVAPLSRSEGVLDTLALGAQAAACGWTVSGQSHAAAGRACALAGAACGGPLGAWRADGPAAALADGLLLARNATEGALHLRRALLDTLASDAALSAHVPVSHHPNLQNLKVSIIITIVIFFFFFFFFFFFLFFV